MSLAWPPVAGPCCCEHHRTKDWSLGTSPTVWTIIDCPLVHGCFWLIKKFQNPNISEVMYFFSHPAVLSLLFLSGRYELDWRRFLICMISCSCGRGVTKVVFSARAAEHQVGVGIKRGEVLSTEVHCSAGIVCDVA